MRVLAAAALAALIAGPAGAETGIEASCANEIRLLCPGMRRSAVLRCLNDHEDDVMSECRLALQTQHQLEEAEPPAEPSAASPAGTTAAPTASVPGRVRQREARLIGALGEVLLHLSGRPKDQYIAVSSGAPLAVGDSVRVGAKGSAEIAFDGATLVTLSTGTDLSLTSLSRAETELGLAVGALAAKVEVLGSAENFSIRTSAAVAAVRGTELIVEQDASGSSRVGIVDEGHVEVTAGGVSVLVGPRQETSVAPGQPPQAPRVVASLRARADAYASVRARAAESAQRWKPMTYARRRAERRRLAAQSPSSAAAPSGAGSPPATAPGVPIHTKGAAPAPAPAGLDKRGH